MRYLELYDKAGSSMDVKNNIFLNKCNTSDVMRKLGVSDSPRSIASKQVSKIQNNLFLTRCNTATVLSKLDIHENSQTVSQVKTDKKLFNNLD